MGRNVKNEIRHPGTLYYLCTAAVAAFGVAVFLSPPPAEGGWIECRDDGTTVIHVTLFKLPDPAATDTFTRAEVAAVREFERTFPEMFAERYRAKYRADPETYGDYNWDRVEVELHQYTGIEVTGVESDLLAIAGKMAADVLYVNFRKSDTYIRHGFLYPLDKPEDGYLAGMTREEIDFRIHPKIWPVIRRKGREGEEHVWAIPYGGALGKVLLYHKELFDEMDLSYPTLDWTWDDLYETCRKLTDPERGIYGLIGITGKHESWSWITYLWTAGGEVMAYDEETDEWRCVFDSREAAVALDFYIRLVAEKWIDEKGKIRRGYVYRGTDQYIKWGRGEIGMTFSYIDEKLFQTLNPETTGMVPVPLGPTGMRAAELNSRMMGLFSQIRERAVRDAAWEYIRFYDSEEAMRVKTRIMVEGGLGRFMNPKYLRLFGYPEVERLAPKGWSEIFEIAISTGRPEPYGRNSNIAYDMMTFPINEAEKRLIRGELSEDREERLDVLQGILRKATARANEEMIGLISPEERRKRDISAAVLLVAIAVTFALVFRWIGRVFAPPEGWSAQKRRWDFRRFKWAYLIMLPALVTILVWRYAPLIRGSLMAFQDYQLLGNSTWVGVRNFGDLLWDFRPNGWWMSIFRAVKYSFLVVGLTFLPPIILAILLQEVPRGRLLFRTIYYLPAVITGLVTVLLWKQFYDPSEYGVLNAVITRVPAIAFLFLGIVLFTVAIQFARRMFYHEMRLAAWLALLAGVGMLAGCAGLARPILFRGGETLQTSLLHLLPRLIQGTPEAYNWLNDTRTAMLSCVIPMVWAGMGPGCLIYLAALKGIPEELYEAADVDGASSIDKILFVVFPMLKALIIINFIGVFIRSVYGAAGNILVMTGGGADTEVATLHIFYKAFIFLRFGPATAMAWILAFLLIGFTVHQLRILSRMEFRTTGGEE